jgi:hypothetical protein
MRPDDYYNALGVELKKIEDDILQLKKRQPNGNDTVQTYINQNTSWDIDWTPTWTYTAGSSRALNKSVLFHASEQPAPVNRMRYYMLVDGVLYTVGSFDDPFMGKAAVNGYVHDTFLSYPNLQPEPGLDAWYFNVTCYVPGTNIKIKFIIDSTDTGTITTMDV